jgi:hypothetical protein
MATAFLKCSSLHIHFQCPHCDKSLVVEAAGAGLTVACPDCSNNIVVPAPAPAQPTPPPPPAEDPVAKLKQLKDMLDADLISAGEYEAKRQGILSRM